MGEIRWKGNTKNEVVYEYENLINEVLYVDEKVD